MGSLALRPATLRFGNSRPRVATTPLPHATKANGQLLGRDFNPLDLLLLLRTVRLEFTRPQGQTRINPRSTALHGWPRTQAIGDPTSYFASIFTRDAPRDEHPKRAPP